MRFKACPRFYGFGPKIGEVRTDRLRQYSFESWGEAKIAIRNAWDERPVYFSIFPFSYLDGQYIMEFDKVSFDLDHPDKFENTWLDYIKIKRFCEVRGWGITGLLTGKGIHVHLPLKPRNIPFSQARDILAILQRKLISHLQLRTVDWATIGDCWRLYRYPNSVYIDKNQSFSHYCVPIYPFDNHNSIKMEAASRRKVPKWRDRIPHEELLSALKEIKPAENPVKIEIPKPSEVEIKPQTMIFRKTCVRLYLSMDNPPAYIRWYAVVYLKILGKDIDQIVDFFESLQMADFNRNITERYVERAYRRYNYVPGHEHLRQMGMCLYDECSEYRHC